MNILVAFPMETFCTADLADGFIEGFKQLGHNVYAFRAGEHLAAKNLLLNLYKQKFNAVVEVPMLDMALEGFFDFVVLHDIELVFVIRGLIPPPIYIEKLKKLGITTALYSTEDPYDWETTKEFAGNYDFVFSNDKIGKVLYNNCEWVPTGSNETVYKPLDNTHKYYDLCFVGTFFKERAELFEQCLPLLKELKVYFAGHWVGENAKDEKGYTFGEFGLPYDHPIREMLGDNRGVTTPPFKVNILYNESKVVPCPHRNKEWLGNTTFEAANFSPRVFEAATSGVFQLVSGNREKLIREFFTEDEIVTYDSAMDFMDKLKYYLKHTEERERIVGNARKKVLSAHTYKHRAEQVLNYIKQ